MNQDIKTRLRENADLDEIEHCEPSVVALEREAADRIEALERQLAEARKDVARIDWLADRDNQIGNVSLPTECVMANLGSMRGAIDMARALPAAPSAGTVNQSLTVEREIVGDKS